MRTPIFSICTALVVMTTLSLGSATYAEPLIPGKPAGVQAAQMGNKEWLVFGGVGILVAAVLIERWIRRSHSGYSPAYNCRRPQHDLEHACSEKHFASRASLALDEG